jgi:hypothetical protein
VPFIDSLNVAVPLLPMLFESTTPPGGLRRRSFMAVPGALDTMTSSAGHAALDEESGSAGLLMSVVVEMDVPPPPPDEDEGDGGAGADIVKP